MISDARGSDARIVIDDLLRQAGWDPADKSMVETEVPAHYALEGLPNKIMVAEYRTALPEERLIAEELDRTRRLLGERKGK